MFKKKHSPVKKKFAVAISKKKRRPLDPRTLLLLRQIMIGLSICTAFVLLGVGIWFGSRLSWLTINNIVVSGGETIDHNLVKEKVNETLSGQYIGLIPKRFVWMYPITDVVKSVALIPRLKDPIIVRDGTTLAVSFSEYIPHGLWCSDINSTDCVFIDHSGYAFAKAPQLNGGAFPRFHTIGTTPTLYQLMVKEDDLKQIEMLRERISQELALPIAYVETDLARDVFMGVAGGGEIKVSLRLTSEETFSNLATILASKEFKDIKPGNFQYIDLRFGNKVFVNEEKPGAATTTATSSILSI